MASKIQSLLLPFYFGHVPEHERLLVERELLTDTEVLLDYLDLKRQVEAADVIPAPSPRLWHRLNAQLTPRKRFVLSAALAAGIVLALIFLLRPKVMETTPAARGTILFDSNSELPANSSVL